MVGFDNSAMYVAAYPDDSRYQDGIYPEASNDRLPGTWHICWLLAGGYYYHALAWVSSGTPQNPTCQPVSVLRVDVPV